MNSLLNKNKERAKYMFHIAYLTLIKNWIQIYFWNKWIWNIWKIKIIKFLL